MKRVGFTLVELSIVLVIIGLLIGGILAAQSMIGTAKVQSVVRTIQQYDIAATNFETKYNGQLPGDSTAFTPAGNGDQTVNSGIHMLSNMNYPPFEEIFYFWQHLNQTGLSQNFTIYNDTATFPGDFTGLVPKLNLGTNCFLNAMTINDTSAGDKEFDNSWVIAAGSSAAINPCLKVSEALALDTKLDDGIPGSGNIQEMYPYNGPRVNAYPVCDTNYDTTKYNVANTAASACMLAIKAQW